MNSEMISLTKEQIELNPLNNWDNGNMKDLVDSISTIGLITPLSLIGPMENGLYRLISGERRYKSICECTKNTDENFEIPCYIVGDSKMSQEMQSILIEAANLEVRETDIQTLNEHRSNVMEQLFALVEKGEITEREVASKAADIFKTSDTYARFWKRIFSSGIPSLKQMVKSGELGVKSANQIAKHLPEEQEKAIKEIEKHILTKEEEPSVAMQEPTGMSKPKSEPAITIQDIIDNISSEEDTVEKIKRETSHKKEAVSGENGNVPKKDVAKKDTPGNYSFMELEDENLDIQIDQDVVAEFDALISPVSPKKKLDVSEASSVKPAASASSFCNLEDFNPFETDTDSYTEEDNSSYDSIDDEYMEKLNIVLSWCKEVMRKDELSDEEWHVVETCKEVVDCFM